MSGESERVLHICLWSQTFFVLGDHGLCTSFIQFLSPHSECISLLVTSSPFLLKKVWEGAVMLYSTWVLTAKGEVEVENVHQEGMTEGKVGKTTFLPQRIHNLILLYKNLDSGKGMGMKPISIKRINLVHFTG